MKNCTGIRAHGNNQQRKAWPIVKCGSPECDLMIEAKPIGRRDKNGERMVKKYCDTICSGIAKRVQAGNLWRI
jgi:hypothetical protein